VSEQRVLQYYYRVNGCKARTSKDDSCICWHDEGTGPFKTERYNDPVPTKEWRISKQHH
jgi:hypothetical protein